MFQPEQNDNEESKGDDASMMSYSVNNLGRPSLSENTGGKHRGQFISPPGYEKRSSRTKGGGQFDPGDKDDDFIGESTGPTEEYSKSSV